MSIPKPEEITAAGKALETAAPGVADALRDGIADIFGPRGKAVAERITLDDTLTSAMMKMAEGNFGAAKVLMDLHEMTPKIDPMNAMGGFGTMLNMDSAGIRGERIWQLYKDVASENYVNMIAVIRANQLGIIDRATLNAAIDNRGKGLDVPAVVKAVKERLPSFNTAAFPWRDS